VPWGGGGGDGGGGSKTVKSHGGSPSVSVGAFNSTNSRSMGGASEKRVVRSFYYSMSHSNEDESGDVTVT